VRADDVAGRLATAATAGVDGPLDLRALFEQHFHPTVRLARLLGADDPE
jgi:hypothetical protein